MTLSFADTIRARRISRGLDRDALARRVGCDERSIRRWEGGGLPQARYVPALRAALDLSLEETDALMLAAIGDNARRFRVEGAGYGARLGIGPDELLARLVALDRRLVGTDAALDADDTAPWGRILAALPDSWRLLTLGDTIICNWHFVPLDPQIYAQCRATDRATWASFANRGALAVVFEGDPALHNPYSVIRVDPARHPHVNAEAGQALIDWLTSPAGQAAIDAFEVGGMHPFTGITGRGDTG